MPCWRVSASAPALALCLVLAAQAEEAARPPASVVIAADALPAPQQLGLVAVPAAEPEAPAPEASADVALALPPPPEPVPLDLGFAADEPGVSVTAALPRRQEPAPLPDLAAGDLAAAMPPPPEPAPVRLDDVAAAWPELPEPAPFAPNAPELPPQTDERKFAQPAPAEPVPSGPAFGGANPAERSIAAQAPSLSPLIAAQIASGARFAWLPEREQRELEAFYEARGHEPLWHDASGPNAAGAALTAQLRLAHEDGLRTEDYVPPRLVAPRPADLALADLRLSALAVRYARDARGARIDPRRLSALITPKLSLPGAAETLARLSASGDVGAALASYQPPHEAYRALKAKLAQIRAERPAAAPSVRIPSGPAVRIGMRDDRIALVRARFGFEPGETRLHDRELATVVASFQRENGLQANGVLNRATVDAMNGRPSAALEGDLIAVMERWRWLPADLGSEHLIVNVPEYMVRKVEEGRIVHSARVVVGKTERPTPIFSDMMDHLVVNPSWTIPPTILRQDILPKLAADPGYAERRGFEVIRRGDRITVRQPPGPSNALGNIKFMFPNDHAVYLHDTPSRNLFASSRRAYSSGCVRVERPLKLAELVLGGAEQGWSERRLQGMIGGGERTIRLERKLPIHIVYMTHVVGEDGAVTAYDDIYGFHRRTREALGL
jgi:murein L,D-transpeptidase YcbB/YkuD